MKHKHTKYPTLILIALFCVPALVIANELQTVETDEVDIVGLYREIELKELMYCESGGYYKAVGDGGDSHGYYQWQKPSLEEVIGQKLTQEQYIAIARNYEEIHNITYETVYEKNQRWRWANCFKKIANEQKR